MTKRRDQTAVLKQPGIHTRWSQSHPPEYIIPNFHGRKLGNGEYEYAPSVRSKLCVELGAGSPVNDGLVKVSSRDFRFVPIGDPYVVPLLPERNTNRAEEPIHVQSRVGAVIDDLFTNTELPKELEINDELNMLRIGYGKAWGTSVVNSISSKLRSIGLHASESVAQIGSNRLIPTYAVLINR